MQPNLRSGPEAFHAGQMKSHEKSLAPTDKGKLDALGLYVSGNGANVILNIPYSSTYKAHLVIRCTLNFLT